MKVRCLARITAGDGGTVYPRITAGKLTQFGDVVIFGGLLLRRSNGADRVDTENYLTRDVCVCSVRAPHYNVNHMNHYMYM